MKSSSGVNLLYLYNPPVVPTAYRPPRYCIRLHKMMTYHESLACDSCTAGCLHSKSYKEGLIEFPRLIMVTSK